MEVNFPYLSQLASFCGQNRFVTERLVTSYFVCLEIKRDEKGNESGKSKQKPSEFADS